MMGLGSGVSGASGRVSRFGIRKMKCKLVFVL